MIYYRMQINARNKGLFYTHVRIDKLHLQVQIPTTYGEKKGDF